MTAVNRAYDALLLDLDGTVWEGGDALEHAVTAINDFPGAAIYVTNNASRAPEDVATMLRAIGLNCTADDVLTSAQAGVILISDSGIAPGSNVLVLGSQSLRTLVADAGYTPVNSADDHPAAVLQGHNPETGWAQLSEAALAIRAGARFYATNLDTSLPQQRGLMIGNGAMVHAVAISTGTTPTSAGKPEPAMFHVAAKRVRATKPLAVGDRLDTDIAGGNAAGMDTLHVMTGVSKAAQLLAAPAHHRPTLLAADLRALNSDIDTLRPGNQGGFSATRTAETVTASGTPTADADPMAIVRTVLGAAWSDNTAPEHLTFTTAEAEKAWKQWT
ncbi:HAD-IIA family hydrolase [Corynebacterium aquilae]|uniref:HAD family hydrolase n=1 Tax=Corynebacterium aquilae DSM 44791 TaxID=1431546 RepID=A0A1L7CFY8_9CORY|nr:HAD-IIA family hydrolase [Corynebacterium aquilae]APT84693.1 HAD family hydrolase [Corynebacterium aquilae DSM 44791]